MQKGKKNWLFFLCMIGLLSSLTVTATSGKMADQSVILRTGNLQLTQVHPISLENELILFQLDQDYVNVFVRYKFRNSGGARKAAFAFPVDYVQFTDQPVCDLVQNFSVKDEYNTVYTLQELDDEATSTFVTRDAEFITYRKWFRLEIPFQANMDRHITVTYRIKAFANDGESYFSYFPEISKRTVQYTLGSGKLTGWVKQFQIIIDARFHPKSEIKTLEVNLPAYVNYDGMISYTAQDFDLNELGELCLSYSNRAQRITDFVVRQRAPGDCIVRISASSLYKENYPATNLLDGNLNTAWIEGAVGGGVGEWIEVELANFQLYSIAMVNGYTKSASTYGVNSKIKKIKIEIEVFNPSTPELPPQMREYTVELARHNYADLHKQYFASFMDVLADFGDNYLIASKLRLTILEVEAGSRYDDTGFTELYLLGERIAESSAVPPDPS